MSQVVPARLIAALEELKSAASARHQLSKPSPEYQAALEREIGIATEIRRLAAAEETDARETRTPRS